MPLLIIAIDGPAGAGKGTLARNLAKIYKLAHLDTGMLYRAVAWRMNEEKNDFTDEAKAREIAETLTLKDLSDVSLRDESIGNLASQVAQFPQVRESLLSFQRNFANHPPFATKGVVLDGRDIGRVVLKDAPCKIFVTASPEVRAQRRLKELHENGISCIYDTVLEDIKVRDERDQKRKFSPLLPAHDAFIIDTSDMGIDEVVNKACSFVNSIYPDAQKMAASSE